MGILWKESAPELMGVKLFLDNVQLLKWTPSQGQFFS